MNKQQSYDNLARLVDKFATNLNDYKIKNYNEAQARVDFINPFFELLGWDIDNKKGLPESYRDVIYEDKLRIGGSVKAPDYCFTINGNRKFFVEAKKPIISIKDKIEPAYQLRRYGWSAKMPVSLLTDFEELSLYDCSLKPNPTDGAFVSRLKYLTFIDYINEFNFLWDVFSKEQIDKGSLTQFINANVSKSNRSSVDAEFLKSLDKWRNLLAHDLVMMNEQLDEDQLNYSLQKIIDRVVFLRICEDRGVEYEEQLLKATKSANIYTELKNIFHIADQKYNSGLFDYNKDNITDQLKVSDEALINIINEMYYPICPYEFSVIPVEILGHSYEQYLGKVIKITSKHDITIEEKPEVRKAGGVYYTPQYIVDYIVKNTVGKLLGNWSSGIEDRDLGLEDSSKNINEVNHESNQKLQGFESLAGINATDNSNLYNHKNISEGGNVLPDKSDEESGGLNSIEHSRGEREIFEERIHSSSINSNRFVSGVGNTNSNSIQSGISESGNIKSDNDSYPKNRSNVRSINQISKSNSLTPIPKPLTPEDVAKLKICDPACGSGSFLLGAYQFLLNWHFDYYTKHPHKSNPLTPDGNLTTTIKKKILLNNIYGVDIDTNAVEVTKLSLMLKALEGETNASINHQLTWFHDRILPTLDDNIKSGNSLIDIDFYDNQIDFEPGQEKKIKPFNWESAFQTVFKQGGFDAVIGNPPYGAELDLYSLNYIKNKYQIGITDTAAVFMIISKRILKGKGYNSFIIPKPFTFASNWGKIRETLLPNITTIVDCSKVWKEVKLEMTIYGIQKGIPTEYFNTFIRSNENINFLSNVNKKLCVDFGFILNGVTEDEIKIGEKIKNIGKYLNEYIINRRGLILNKFVESGTYKVIGCKEIGRYLFKNIRGLINENLVNTNAEINSNHVLLQGIVAHIANPKDHIKLMATIIDSTKDLFIADNINQLIVNKEISNKFILGVINSKLLSWYCYRFLYGKSIRTMRIDNPISSRIPIPIIDFRNKKFKSNYEKVISLVETMLQLNKDLQSAILPEQKEHIQQRINYTDKQIDTLVYELYELTGEEIRIVEGELAT